MDAVGVSGEDSVPASTFHHTVDVLELVCEAAGFAFDKCATLLALRCCSRAWVGAVSGTIRRGYGWPAAAGSLESRIDDDDDESTGAMDAAVAVLPTAARLCVVSQPYGAVQNWLRSVPKTVLQATDARRMLRDLRMLQRYVARPTALRFDRNGAALTADDRKFVEALAVLGGATLESLSVAETAVAPAFVKALLTSLPSLKRIAFTGTGAATAENAAAVTAACGDRVQYLEVSDNWRELTADAVTVAARCPAMRRLDLSGADITDASLAALSHGCPQLESLALCSTGRGSTGDALIAAAGRWPHLTHLDVSYKSDAVDDATIAAIARLRPQLQRLNVSFTAVTDDGLAAVAESCPALRHLAASSAVASDATLVAIADRCPHLEYLDVDGAGEGVTDAGVLALTAARCELRHLDVSRTAVTDAAVRAIAERYPKLQFLGVADVLDGRVTSAAVGAIGCGCPDLRQLVARGCRGAVSAAGLLPIARGCPRLEHLDASHSNGAVTDQVIQEVARRCPRLQVLDVGWTDGWVTNLGVCAVAEHCPELVELCVTATGGKVTDIGIAAVAKKCALLDTLNVAAMRGAVTDASVSLLADGCPWLRMLDAADNEGKITAASTEVLAARGVCVFL